MRGAWRDGACAALVLQAQRAPVGVGCDRLGIAEEVVGEGKERLESSDRCLEHMFVMIEGRADGSQGDREA